MDAARKRMLAIEREKRVHVKKLIRILRKSKKAIKAYANSLNRYESKSKIYKYCSNIVDIKCDGTVLNFIYKLNTCAYSMQARRAMIRCLHNSINLEVKEHRLPKTKLPRGVPAWQASWTHATENMRIYGQQY